MSPQTAKDPGGSAKIPSKQPSNFSTLYSATDTVLPSTGPESSTNAQEYSCPVCSGDPATALEDEGSLSDQIAAYIAEGPRTSKGLAFAAFWEKLYFGHDRRGSDGSFWGSSVDGSYTELRERSLLELLPYELLEAIMMHLPDVASLRSFVGTCRAIYNSFSLEVVLPKVVENEIGHRLLPFAIFVRDVGLKAETDPEKDEQDVMDLIDRFKQLDFETSWTLDWKAKDALEAYELHQTCSAIADRFCTKMLNSEEGSVSESERHRILRTLYLFEAYCRLFWMEHKDRRRRHSHIRRSAEKQKTHFLALLSGYEIEQLAVLRLFLMNLLRPAVECMILHDIEFDDKAGIALGTNGLNMYEVMLGIEFGDLASHGIGTNYIYEVLLSHGLEYVHQLATGSCYEDWKPLFVYRSRSSWLTRALDHADPRISYNYVSVEGLYHGDLDKDRVFEKLGSPKFKEDDKGPYEAWFRAYLAYPDPYGYNNLYNQMALYAEYEWGYVFWDSERYAKSARLENLHECEESWRLCPCRTYWDFDDFEESVRANMIKRRWLWSMGCTGYWKDDDGWVLKTWPWLKDAEYGLYDRNPHKVQPMKD